MFRIKSVSYPTSFKGHISSTDAWETKIPIAVGLGSSVGSVNVRGKPEFIKNSGPFDRFNNTEVRNIQWKGEVYLRHYVDDDYAFLSPRDAELTMLSCAPITNKISGSHYVLVDRQNLIFETQTSKRYTCAGGAGWVRGTQGDEGYFYIRLDTSGTKLTYQFSGQWKNYPITSLLVAEFRTRLGNIIATFPKEVARTFASNHGGPLRPIIRNMVTQICNTYRGEGTKSSVVGKALTRTISLKGATVDPEMRWIREDLDWRIYPQVFSLHHFSDSERSVQGRNTLEELNHFDGNLIAYVTDLKDLGGTLKSVTHLAEHPSVRSAASAWLSGRYGDRLSYKDTRDLISSLRRALVTGARSIGRSQISFSGEINGFSVSHTRTATIVAESKASYAILGLIGSLMQWDAWPTLENTWDLIPLSFVVDWFLPISDLLGQIDAYVERPYFNVSAQYVSDRYEVEVPYVSDDASGTLRYIDYHRRPHRVLDDIRPFDVTPTLPTFSPINLIDAIALTVN